MTGNLLIASTALFFSDAALYESSNWNKNGWIIPGNAMEIINSGALQSDMRTPVLDWFGLLNSGKMTAGVGASDSHTVSRYLLGQARTYIYGEDKDPANLPTEQIIQNFAAGKTMVSFGLLTEIIVNEKAVAGDTIKIKKPTLTVTVRVSGPSWTKADTVALYANGIKIKEVAVQDPGRPGIKWEKTWSIPTPKHDIFLAAIATGPGKKNQPYWQIARPYQPTVSKWTPMVMGVSGAVFVSTHPIKEWQSASQYASTLVKDANGNLPILLRKMKSFDEAVAIQVARHLYIDGISPDKVINSPGFLNSSPATVSGFKKFLAGL